MALTSNSSTWTTGNKIYHQMQMGKIGQRLDIPTPSGFGDRVGFNVAEKKRYQMNGRLL